MKVRKLPWKMSMPILQNSLVMSGYVVVLLLPKEYHLLCSLDNASPQRYAVTAFSSQQKYMYSVSVSSSAYSYINRHTLTTPLHSAIRLQSIHSWENPTCERRLICLWERVLSLNKCNPMIWHTLPLTRMISRVWLGTCQLRRGSFGMQPQMLYFLSPA